MRCGYLPHIVNSSLCGISFALIPIVSLTALKTKEFARWRRRTCWKRPAGSRHEFELTVASCWCNLGRNSSSFMGARGKTVMWAFRHNINTRFNQNLHLPSTNLTLVRKEIFFSGSKIYNQLPLRIKMLYKDIKHLKSSLRTYLTEHAFIVLMNIIN
jgi:hypothetical protein